MHGKERSSIDKKEKMWKVVSNTRRGDNIRDININYTSYIFIERLLQKRILFFFFFLFMHSRRLEISEKSFIRIANLSAF